MQHKTFWRYPLDMAPTVWNILPDDIRNAPAVMLFRKKLKSYYFDILSRPPDGW